MQSTHLRGTLGSTICYPDFYMVNIDAHGAVVDVRTGDLDWYSTKLLWAR